MGKVIGKIKKTIFHGDNGFFVGVFKVSETDIPELNLFIKKEITITGLIIDFNETEEYILEGEYIKHERYGYQFKFNSYSKKEITGRDAIIDYLSSPIVKGCGKATATLIVDTLGETAIDEIKANMNNLLIVPKMTQGKALKIYNSIMANSSSDDLILELKSLGFKVSEAMRVISTFKDKTRVYLRENLYYFKTIIDFDRLDKIYVSFNDPESILRKRECILEAMKNLSDIKGDIYYYKEEIYNELKLKYKIILDEEEFSSILNDLVKRGSLKNINERYYLMENYLMEIDIADRLFSILKLPKKEIKNFDKMLKSLEESLNISYNIKQKNAIKKALEERITIISGGPGVGKTTIINAITRLFIENYNLSSIEVISSIALLAPTGRAAKKMSDNTNIKASTIHRYLKWNKDNNQFMINEYNKNFHKLIIVDEVSMIDTYLFSSLLKGINDNIQLILVGDNDQLPSVSAGLILNDLIESNLFTYISLNTIYRQSEDSYIPYLAKEIRERNLSLDFKNKKDDYNFLEVSSKSITGIIKEICKKCISKGIDTRDLQVLAPMYKGENGIDNLNIILQELFNPLDEKKNEIKFGASLYREGDKVLQLVNNPDANIFNGDIGYIIKISKKDKKTVVTVDFDGNYVDLFYEDLFNIKHA